MMKHSRKPCLHGVYAGLFGKVFTAFIAVAAVTLAYGADYYVDANYGNDAWDGTTAAIPDQATIDAGGTIAGPRKTLHAMMSDERIVAGDTVWAAEGDYKEGGTVNGDSLTLNRVQVKPGVLLCASGSRDNTFISGSGGNNTAEAGATRCVYFLPTNEVNGVYGHGIVNGFTIRNGRTAAETEHGGGSTGPGLMVECDFQSNGCNSKTGGGTMDGGCGLRCCFTSYSRGYLGYYGTKIIDSLIECGPGFYNACYAYHSTFSGDAYVRENSRTYNCLFIGTGAASSKQKDKNKSKHYGTLSRSSFNTDCCTVNSVCYEVTAYETPYDETTFRPLAGSVAIDGDKKGGDYYRASTNGWPKAWCEQCGKDYYGGNRFVGKVMDIGCGERQSGASLAIVDESDGLVIEGAEKGLSQVTENTEVTFSRTFTSDKLCLGVEINGVFHSFGGTTSDVPYSVTLQGQDDRDYSITAIYETDQKDWYVNEKIGNNENKGYHKNCPRRTLDKAMELAVENAGHVVHAAAGTYDSFADGDEYASANSRVTVKEGVGLVADDWPLDETIIKGAPDTTSGPEDNGNGPNAVRCVTVNKNGYVRGFKLTGGRTKKDSYGGGAYLLAPAALVDCEITGNDSGYRGIAVTTTGGESGTLGWLIRCHVHGNKGVGSFQLTHYTSLIDSYVDEDSKWAFYGKGGATILNSTVVNGGMRAFGDMVVYNSCIQSVSTTTGEDAKIKLFNCATSIAKKDDVTDANIEFDESSCIFSATAADNIGANSRPKTADSVLVDAGNKEYYDTYFPAQFAQFKIGDYNRDQRIYNGQIDIGCAEYDFRPDFAALLGSRAVISEMGPNVTTNVAANVVVPEGESIAMSVPSLGTDREIQYKLVYTPEGGSQVEVSERSADDFSCRLNGACTIQSLNRYFGFVLSVR